MSPGLPVCTVTRLSYYSLGGLLSGSRDVSWRSLEVVELVLAQSQRFLTADSFRFLKNVHKNPRSPRDKPFHSLGVLQRRQSLKYHFTVRMGKTKAD